jgi:hypothetical protein
MKKKILNYLQVAVVPFILQLLIRFIYFTNKKIYHHTNVSMGKKSFIVALWHGDLIMQPFNYKKFKPDGSIRAVISEHRDGEAIQKTVAYLGIGSLSGSSTRGGAKAMIGAIKALKQGIDIAITPDGPKGPIYSIADGIVAIAQKTDSMILPFSSKPSKYWQFNSWDKFIIPKPFGTIDFYIGDPFSVQGMDMEEAKQLILEKMMQNQLEK